MESICVAGMPQTFAGFAPEDDVDGLAIDCRIDVANVKHAGVHCCRILVSLWFAPASTAGGLEKLSIIVKYRTDEQQMRSSLLCWVEIEYWTVIGNDLL